MSCPCRTVPVTELIRVGRVAIPTGGRSWLNHRYWSYRDGGLWGDLRKCTRGRHGRRLKLDRVLGDLAIVAHP
jgi:hypothetical protein